MADAADAGLEAALAMVVEFRAAPGRRDELRDALLALVEPTRLEDGCLLYDLHESRDDADMLAFYEVWRDADAHAAHDRTAHVGRFREIRGPLLAEPARVLRLRRIEP
jgi:quinol monooxygenase YgiN